jgi:two-component system, NarL family, response regulator DevR
MSRPLKIRVLIVDDHPIVRNGLRIIEEINPQIEVVGEASNGADTLKKAAALRPDVILLDYRLPDLSGHEVCRQVKQEQPGAKVLFLSSYAAECTALAALEAGASGYLLKENEAQKIVDAITTVVRGGTVVDPMIAQALIRHDPARAATPARKLAELSPQEMKVLREIATGKTDKEVADTLGLQTKTVRNYLDHIFAKLGVHTRTHAAALYLQDSKSES